MCNAACIDEALNLVHIVSEFIDISEVLSSCLSWSLMFCDYSLVPSVSRGMLRFWETSRIFWISTILSVSWGMLNRMPSGDFVSFFPGPHFRVSCTPRAFRVTRKILSHRYAFTLNETTCSCFRCWRSRSEELSWDLFDISDCFLAERKEWLWKWLQENVVSFMVL